jgi:hypothetical protein
MSVFHKHLGSTKFASEKLYFVSTEMAKNDQNFPQDHRTIFQCFATYNVVKLGELIVEVKTEL